MDVLLCVSASHKTASFDLLERLSVPATPVAPLIAEHDECVQGAVVVATCNRFEAYVDMDEPVTAAVALGIEATLAAIESATGVPASELEGSRREVRRQARAARDLGRDLPLGRRARQPGHHLHHERAPRR